MTKIEKNQQLRIDLAARSGMVKHGATGFLYGLGNDGIPSANMLAPLKPQVAAQKPEGGAQHPNGDALDVANLYQSAGGREIQIYLQDDYPNWPYDNLGLADYLARVVRITQQVKDSPFRELFSFVPLNEPDQIWYNKGDRRQALLDDWEAIYRAITATHPAARIVGPNFAHYDSDFYREFLAFAREHDCLPDVTSWHELQDDFFAGWYRRYEDYRASERSLKIPAREVCINEYCRIKGDLTVPGRLVQWITRFENSKVDACLAYWTDAGSLNNLVTRDNYNKASGAWWLYRWYAGLSGETVRVVPPDSNAEGLQGLGAYDGHRIQARILFGGCAGPVEVLVSGFDAVPGFGREVHAAAWVTEATGNAPAGDPQVLFEADFPIRDGQARILVNAPDENAACLVILTPGARRQAAVRSGRYLGAYADTSSGMGAAPGVTLAEGEPAAGGHWSGTHFVVTAAENRFYQVHIQARGASDAAPAFHTLHMQLNGAPIETFHVPGGMESRAVTTFTVYLTAGINRIDFYEITARNLHAAGVDFIEVAAVDGPVSSYEAQAPENLLEGSAAIAADPAASGGKYVGQIGDGDANALVFREIVVSQVGSCRMAVYFANADFRGGHSYNSQVVDRTAEIRVNGGEPQRVYFRNTFAWDNYQSRVVDIELQAGQNTIRFSNPDAGEFAPHIDRIEIAPLKIMS